MGASHVFSGCCEFCFPVCQFITFYLSMSSNPVKADGVVVEVFPIHQVPNQIPEAEQQVVSRLSSGMRT